MEGEKEMSNSLSLFQKYNPCPNIVIQYNLGTTGLQDWAFERLEERQGWEERGEEKKCLNIKFSRERTNSPTLLIVRTPCASAEESGGGG